MKTIIVLGVMIIFCACTDAVRGKIFALGESASVECWSGGKLIFKGKSTGKVSSEKSSDGYFFKDSKDGKFKEVSGNCVIVYGE